ncbi:restriction endonuclease [Candidatus Nomurabacteria bacterium]|nr:restriction endonuclease [Candidatus Nomurabacteria bacterium]
MSVTVIKHNGETEVFDPDKLRDSLMRAKTSIITADEIVAEIVAYIKNGMTTDEIYKKAFAILNKKDRGSAAVYSIRRSILDLGPSGFPFEKFFAEILRKKGYEVQNNVPLKGKCVEHEVDAVAYDDDSLFFAEIKFHNQLGVKTDTKVGLYVKARFDDLASEKFIFDGKEMKLTKGLLITNTKFTNNLIKYANCVGNLELISWDYPEKGNLYDLIAETNLQPTTCIPQLTKREKRELVDRGLVNCASLKDNEEAMREVGVPDKKIKEVVDNIDAICSV